MPSVAPSDYYQPSIQILTANRTGGIEITVLALLGNYRLDTKGYLYLAD